MITRADEYFLTVIKCGSLSKAAEMLYLSQPSLTRQIKHLEARLGTHLFNHETKPLQLNAAGEVYRQYLLDTIQKETQLLKDLQEANENKRGSLSIGVPSFLGQYLLPRVLPLFYESYPNVTIDLQENSGAVLQSAVAAGELDIAFAYIPVTEVNVCQVRLASEHVLIAVPASEPLTEEEWRQGMARIRPMDPDLLPELEYCMPMESQMLGRSAQKLFVSHSIVPKVIVRSKSPLTCMNLIIAMKRGAAFVPSYILPQLSPLLQENLIFYRLDTPELEWDFSALYNKNKVLSVFSQRMIAIVKETDWKSAVPGGVAGQRTITRSGTGKGAES